MIPIIVILEKKGLLKQKSWIIFLVSKKIIRLINSECFKELVGSTLLSRRSLFARGGKRPDIFLKQIAPFEDGAIKFT